MDPCGLLGADKSAMWPVHLPFWAWTGLFPRCEEWDLPEEKLLELSLDWGQTERQRWLRASGAVGKR